MTPKTEQKAMLRFLNGEVINKKIPLAESGQPMKKIYSSNDNVENVELVYDCTLDNEILLYLQTREHLKTNCIICPTCGFKSEKFEDGEFDIVTIHTKDDCIKVLTEKISFLKGIQ